MTPTVFIPLYSTLYDDCSHIEDMHLVICAHFMNEYFFHFFFWGGGGGGGGGGLKLANFGPSVRNTFGVPILCNP